VGKEKY